MKKTLLVSAMIMGMGAAQAASPIWNSAAVSYQNGEFAGTNVDADGFMLDGSFGFAENFFARGGYASYSGDINAGLVVASFDYDNLFADVGYRYALNQSTDVYGLISYRNVSGDLSAADYVGDALYFSDSNSAFGVGGGIRSMITDQVELGAEAVYYNFDDADTQFDVHARYFFTDAFSGDLGYRDDIGVKGVYAGVRWHF